MNSSATCHKAVFSTVNLEFIPNTQRSDYAELRLIDLNPRTVACVYSYDRKLCSVTLNLQTHKAIFRIASKATFALTVESNSLVIKENNQTIVVLRRSKNEFFMFSLPRLRLVSKFVPAQSTKVQQNLCYMNGELITWCKSKASLSFWQLMGTKPSSSLMLPFTVRSTYAQLTNRNLLILQNGAWESNELVFVDVKQKKISGMVKLVCKLACTINSEDRLFSYWKNNQHGVQSGVFFCESVASDLKLKQIGKLSLSGPLKRAILLDGARVILMESLGDYECYEIADDQLITFPFNRSQNEQYPGFLKHPKEKKRFCLVTQNGKLLMLHLTDIKQ